MDTLSPDPNHVVIQHGSLPIHRSAPSFEYTGSLDYDTAWNRIQGADRFVAVAVSEETCRQLEFSHDIREKLEIKAQTTLSVALLTTVTKDLVVTQLQELTDYRLRKGGKPASSTELPSGSWVVKVPGVPVVGWNRPTADVLIHVPIGYPSAPPSNFWVEPGGFRLAGGGLPRASNDNNPIPGDHGKNRRTSFTWFSWHPQNWDLTRDTLKTYFHMVEERLRLLQ